MELSGVELAQAGFKPADMRPIKPIPMLKSGHFKIEYCAGRRVPPSSMANPSAASRSRFLIEDANGHATTALGDPVRLAEYDYFGDGRLTAVTRYLAPAAGNLPPGPGFVTNYSYDGSSNRIASVPRATARLHRLRKTQRAG